jgi:regulator of replication initiation timing
MSEVKALSAFESEVIRLLTENNRILKENQVLMKENKALLIEANNNLRKVIINTS